MSILCLKISSPSHFLHFQNWPPKINPFQKLYPPPNLLPPPPRDVINDRSLRAYPCHDSQIEVPGVPWWGEYVARHPGRIQSSQRTSRRKKVETGGGGEKRNHLIWLKRDRSDCYVLRLVLPMKTVYRIKQHAFSCRSSAPLLTRCLSTNANSLRILSTYLWSSPKICFLIVSAFFVKFFRLIVLS